jgi:hypothetical protein
VPARGLAVDEAPPGFADTLPETTLVARKDVRVAAPHPPEFRQRAVELARMRKRPIREVVKSLGISESGLRNRIVQAGIAEGAVGRWRVMTRC